MFNKLINFRVQNRFCSNNINKENIAIAGTMNDGMCAQLLDALTHNSFFNLFS